jgi:hypothetical protein
MVAPHDAEINLDAYARLTVALSRAGEARDTVLATHGLDEDRWQAIDDVWQARIAEAMDEGTDEQPVSPFVEEFAKAMDRAQSDDSQVLTFERYVQATRAMSRGGDVAKSLGALGVTVDAYVQANRYWVRRMATDDELAGAFQRALG